jgi:hypothetical protein
LVVGARAVPVTMGSRRRVPPIDANSQAPSVPAGFLPCCNARPATRGLLRNSAGRRLPAFVCAHEPHCDHAGATFLHPSFPIARHVSKARPVQWTCQSSGLAREAWRPAFPGQFDSGQHWSAARADTAAASRRSGRDVRCGYAMRTMRLSRQDVVAASASSSAFRPSSIVVRSSALPASTAKKWAISLAYAAR